MPTKALVVFRVMLGFGLLAISGPAWCSDADIGELDIVQTADMTLKTTQEELTTSATTTPSLTLDDALTRTLQRNPKLAAFSQEVKARDFEMHQAGLRPNPEVSVEIDNVAGSGAYSGTDSAETTLRISQRIELGGKRMRRQDVGRLDRQLSERDYDIARSEVLATATARFVATLAAQKRLTLAEEQVALTLKVLRSVEDRIMAGKTAEIERVRFQTLTAEARLRQNRAAREFTRASRTLAAIWGSETIDFDSVAGQLEQIQNVPDWSKLTAMLAQGPRIARQKSTTRRAEHSLALARAGRIPDLTFSLGAKNSRESGDNALVAEISIPLPLFDRNQNQIAAATARQAKAAGEARNVQLKLLAELAEGWEKLHSAHSEATVLRDEILPATEQMFAAVTYGYQSGKFGFLEVLDAERTLFESKNRYVDALTVYHQTVADLERLLGDKIFVESSTAGTGSVLPVNKRGQS